MHRSAVEHALRLRVVLAFSALAVGTGEAPEEAKSRPLPEDTRELAPVTCRTEEFQPQFSFMGLKFLYSFTSEQIHGVGRDAAHIADAIAARRGKSQPDRPVANQQDQMDSGGSQAHGERRST